MTNNVIYTKDLCPFCDAAKNFFKIYNLPYTELKLGSDFKREEFLEKFGDGSTYPQIYVWGKYVGGFNALLDYADETNMLAGT
jgi:glutaredoxin